MFDSLENLAMQTMAWCVWINIRQITDPDRSTDAVEVDKYVILLKYYRF